MTDDKHKHNVMLRLDAEGHAKLDAWAEAHSLPRAVAARALIGKALGGELIKPRRNRIAGDVSILIGELRRVGHNLNQAVHLMHMGTSTDDLARQLQDTLQEIGQLKREILDALHITREP
jgi:hypothetical protein